MFQMESPSKTYLSIVVPCYNEEAILQENMNVIQEFLKSREAKYNWEILIIKEGIRDGKG